MATSSQAPPAATAAVIRSGTTSTTSQKIVGLHIFKIDSFSATKDFCYGKCIKSSTFRVGGHVWYIECYPGGHDMCTGGFVSLFLCRHDDDHGSSVSASCEFKLMESLKECYLVRDEQEELLDRRRVSSGLIQRTELEPLLKDDCFHVRCLITATPNQHQGVRGDLQRSQHVRGDVTFDVGGPLFAAHKCVLATRCTAFMPEFFAPSRKENADVTDRVRVEGMEPRVFEALLHFIYTDALPEVHVKDMVVMTQSLLVAADRYAMERLKLICGDLLCSCINDARTAVTTLDIADKHGPVRLGCSLMTP